MLNSGPLTLHVYSKLYAKDGDWRAFDRAFPFHYPDEKLKRLAMIERGKYLQALQVTT